MSSVNKVSFAKSVSSSMITMLLQSAYSMVDGLFVSNMVDSDALAAINIAWPIIAVITALGTGIGAGGASLMGIKQGEGKWKESEEIKHNIITCLILGGVTISLIMFPLLNWMLTMMGASGNLLDEANTYARIMVACGTMQMLSCGLTPILRNENKQVKAMNIMIIGLCINLTMNFTLLYFFKLGIAGAAIASVCSQLFTVVCCVRNLKIRFRMKDFKPNWRICGNILRVGISPFGISLTPSLLIFYHNVACLRVGDLAVSAYALISSTIGSYRVLLIGVAEGMQPLTSKAYGAARNINSSIEERIGAYGEIKKLRNKAIITAVAISVGLFLFTIATAGFYSPMYGYTGEVARESYYAVMITAAQLIFTGIVRVANSFFYSVGKNKYSLIMIYFDPLIMTPICLILLSHFWGATGIWLNAVITQAVLNVIAFFMFRRHDRQMNAEVEVLRKSER